MSKLSIAAFLSLFPNLSKSSKHDWVFSHKNIKPSGITKHKPKPGRNHPVKGYDQENHKWI